MKSSLEVGAKPRWPAFLAYLSCIRYSEVLLLQGSPLLGAAFALGDVSAEKAAGLAVFALASFLLVAHIWSFNDWAGIAADLNDPNKSGTVFSTKKGVTARGLLFFSLGLLLASLALFATLPLRTLLIAVTIALLSVLYSHPAFHAKSIPLLSSVPHAAGGILHFLLGYSLFDAIDHRGVMIAIFFALTFTAGHLNQEVRDYEGDRFNRLFTNAVFFGRHNVFLAGLVMFTLAYGDLVFLAYRGLVPPLLGVVALVLYPVQFALSIRTLRIGLNFDSISRLQGSYRILYGLIGLSMLATLFFR
jgi:4-hydroxybenzoate polyprenyltransferase